MPFWRRKDELTVEGEYMLWGMRVVIPSKWRDKVLDELHKCHPGVVLMKTLARSHIWWSNLDSSIERRAKACTAGQGNKHLPPKAPLHYWPWPHAPWDHIHIDFAGPFMGKMLFIVVDAHSKWPEVCIMTSTINTRTISVLREMFARFGLPKQLVSDSGPQFTSDEFEQFLVNGVNHIRSSPYHPSSNGTAERLVQTVKQALRSSCRDGLSFERALASFLLRYHCAPHATTGVSPSSLFLGRNIRTHLDLLKPNDGARVMSQQDKQKAHHDRHSRCRELEIRQPVWARNFRKGPRWVQVIVADRIGPLSYLVKLLDGDLWRRHIDHLREGGEVVQSSLHGNDFPVPPYPESRTAEDVVPRCPPCPAQAPMPAVEPDQPHSKDSHISTDTSLSLSDLQDTRPVPERRYPSRNRRLPDRLYSTLD